MINLDQISTARSIKRFINRMSIIKGNNQIYEPNLPYNVFHYYLVSFKFLFLTQLKIEHQRVQSIPRIEAPILQQLYLNNTDVRSIKQFASRTYPALTKIQINGLNFEELPQFNTPNLSKIVIINSRTLNSIKQFSKCNYPQLTYIDLKNNVIDELPQFNAPNLEILDLQANRIRQISSFLKGNYQNFKAIDASNNQIFQLPQFSKFKKMQQITLRQNQIENINEFSKGEYPQLLFLQISNNKIKSLPYINAPNLYEVDFAFNQISSVREFCLNTEITSLKLFCLSNNLLSSLTEFENIKVQILKLQNNIRINYNRKLQDSFKYSNIKSFYLGFNHLKSIPIFLSSLTFQNLKQIFLPSNQIDNIELLLHLNLLQIQTIDLSHNKIRQLKAISHLRIPKIGTINLLQNPNLPSGELTRCQINDKHHFQQMFELKGTGGYVQISQQISNHNLNWMFKLQDQFLKCYMKIGKVNFNFLNKNWRKAYLRKWIIGSTLNFQDQQQQQQQENGQNIVILQ